jgi:uncharacterized protein (DUF885 family)
LKDNLMPVRFLLEKVPAQCEGVVTVNLFLLPRKKYPSAISTEDQQRLTQEITDVVNHDVLPAYEAFAAFVTAD